MSKPQFNPELPPDNPINRRAAEARGLVYDDHHGMYRDKKSGQLAACSDGTPVLDFKSWGPNPNGW